MKELLIACVGKPSAGKSSFLNAVTDANAKTGNYPFTTIEPNQGVTFMRTACPCQAHLKTLPNPPKCNPRYGKCVSGERSIPVKMLDVAGLIPGASEGLGLGNKFLDDLRHADVLIHVVDVSGTTNEKGENTSGYDPINDIDWLWSEIHAWVYGNLQKKWGSIVKKHVANKADPVHTLQLQLSGYGVNEKMVAKFMSKLKTSLPLEQWDDETLKDVVSTFLEERFPTVIALNKIDLPDSDRNISKICRKYDANRIVLTSALAECFLRKMHKERFIHYTEGSDNFLTADDESAASLDPPLKRLDDKTRNRLEKIKDLCLYRYGGTGCADAIKMAVDIRGFIPVYPVRNINNFTSSESTSGGAFRDCILLPPNTTVREFARMLSDDLDKYYLYAETVGGIRLGEDDIITASNNIISFKTQQSENPQASAKK